MSANVTNQLQSQLNILSNIFRLKIRLCMSVFVLYSISKNKGVRAWATRYGRGQFSDTMTFRPVQVRQYQFTHSTLCKFANYASSPAIQGRQTMNYEPNLTWPNQSLTASTNEFIVQWVRCWQTGWHWANLVWAKWYWRTCIGRKIIDPNFHKFGFLKFYWYIHSLFIISLGWTLKFCRLEVCFQWIR